MRILFTILLLTGFVAFSSAQPGEAMRAYNKGLSYYKDKNFDEALPYLKKAIWKDPDFEAAQMILARIYEAQGRLSFAIRHYKRVLAINSEQKDVWMTLSRLYVISDEPEMAKLALENALYHNPEFDIAKEQLNKLNDPNQGFDWGMDGPKEEIDHFELAQEHFTGKDYDQALLDLEPILKENPDAGSYFLAGKCYEKKGQPEKAILYFQKTLDLNRNHSDALTNLGSIAFNQNDMEGAFQFFSEALHHEKENAELYFLYGETALNLNLPEEAIFGFESGLNLKINDTDALFQLAMAYEIKGDRESCLQNLEKAAFFGNQKAARQLADLKIEMSEAEGQAIANAPEPVQPLPMIVPEKEVEDPIAIEESGQEQPAIDNTAIEASEVIEWPAEVTENRVREEIVEIPEPEQVDVLGKEEISLPPMEAIQIIVEKEEEPVLPEEITAETELTAELNEGITEITIIEPGLKEEEIEESPVSEQPIVENYENGNRNEMQSVPKQPLASPPMEIEENTTTEEISAIEKTSMQEIAESESNTANLNNEEIAFETESESESANTESELSVIESENLLEQEMDTAIASIGAEFSESGEFVTESSFQNVKNQSLAEAKPAKNYTPAPTPPRSDDSDWGISTAEEREFFDKDAPYQPNPRVAGILNPSAVDQVVRTQRVQNRKGKSKKLKASIKEDNP